MQVEYTETPVIRKDIVVSARVPTDIRSELGKIAEERGLKVGAIAREALIQYLERQLAS